MTWQNDHPTPWHVYDRKKDQYQNGGIVDARGRVVWGGWDNAMPSDEAIAMIVEVVNKAAEESDD